ncbi:GDSL esterase/lipase At5g14450 isoform X2 [Andrographis paniculata]|uniref:GDSL esterase/lipase At5g14450 isoform X2 n=1 Tax=Andrographis paniculata TaxID=175694 RepID=UPI0021E873A0|nr:GDSL esterase/lipase At5g14450 isoform X2 [Andrographis paniculata]
MAKSINGSSAPAASRCNFPAIYNFGDSNSDTGAISAAFWPIPPPYGVTYFRKPSGRHSDGRLIIDFIAERLRLPLLSSYLDSIGTDFRHGANFATAGSPIRRQNETIMDGVSPFSLDIQTSQFAQFKDRTTELHRHAARYCDTMTLPNPKEFSRALYTLDIGQNDLVVGFRKLTMPQIKAQIPDIINQFAAAVVNLYQKGSRAFWIHNTGPIGCLPGTRMYFRSKQPGLFDSHGCIRGHNAIALEFNRQLKARVALLRAHLRHASLVYVDIYSAKYHLISNAKVYGFDDPMKICCGHHKDNVHVWCGQRVRINGTEVVGTACSAPRTCISWDGVHYSEAANEWIATRILNGSYSDPPLPISNACS